MSTPPKGSTLGELAVRFGCTLKGDPDIRVTHVAALEDADGAAITFLANPKYRRHLSQTRAGAVVIDPRLADACPTSALLASNPYATYARIAALLHPLTTVEAGVHPSAIVDPDADVDVAASVGAKAVIEAGATIGPRAIIGPGSVVMRGARIGSDTRLVANVTLCHDVTVGERCILHPGVVIGADGFGLAPDRGQWVKVPQVGSVVIGNDVEVGANTTIDRGAIGDTVIGDGVKLDNQIQIAHNVRIGAHTAIAGCAGISGSATIGQRCMIGGMVGVAGHLTICDDVVVTGKSFVSGSIRKPGYYSSGIPVDETTRFRKNAARFGQLDEMARELRRLRTGGTDAMERDDLSSAADGEPSAGEYTTSQNDRGDRMTEGGATGQGEQVLTMDINEVLRRLPHRYPFLLVDRVQECIAGKSIRALKNVTFNEHFFPGHFPHRPVFPGVMILEALAQTAGILAFVTAGVYPDSERPMYFVGIDNARFRRPVEPGDQLILKATLERSMRGIWKFATVAEVNGEEVTSASMMVAPGTGTK